MTKSRLQDAELNQVLLWYDEAEICLCKISIGEYVIAVASGYPSDVPGTFYGSSITIQSLVEYQDEKFDLRYALQNPAFRRHWRFSYPLEGQHISLQQIPKSSLGLITSFPESGFFAREHQAISAVKQFQPDIEEVFNLDGGWDVDEISKFYGHMEDVYYIVNDLVRWTQLATNSPERNAISQAFDKPFQGGGSYVSMYRDVANDNARYAKLKFAGIDYHSPGKMTVQGKASAMGPMLNLLYTYSSRLDESKAAYRSLYGYMQKTNLLSNSKTPAVSGKVLDGVRGFAEGLAVLLPGVSFATVLDMASGDEIVAAKVVLSIHRRVDSLFEFFNQGRAKHPVVRLD